MSEFILIGTIGSPMGYSGEFVVVSAQKAIEKLPKDLVVRIGFSENFAKNYKLEYYSIKASGKTIAKLSGINSKEDIVIFKEQGIFASAEEVKKHNPDYYSIDEVVGCKVIIDSDGSLLGEIVEVWELPANDVWLVATDKGELPLPVIEDVIVEYDFSQKYVKINLLDGLLDLVNSKEASDED